MRPTCCSFSLGDSPPTGEPDAGDPHVRFGGRGGVILRPYPYLKPGSCPRGADPPIRGAKRVRSESRGCLREKRSESLSRTKRKIVSEGRGSSDPRRESSSERIERMPVGEAQRVSFSHQEEDRARGVRILRSAARIEFGANREDACGRSAASLFLAPKGRSCPRGADPPIRGVNRVRSESRGCLREQRSGSLARRRTLRVKAAGTVIVVDATILAADRRIRTP